VLATLFATAVAAVPAYLGLSFGAALSRSHIDANVPEQAHFDEYLRRDLTAYFTAVDSSVTDVKYDLLRKAPTQVGVGFPKYYAWIAIHSERSGLEQGVVRLAAEDRAKFEVTTFLTSNEVLSRPQRVLDQFPPALNGEILRRARNASR